VTKKPDIALKLFRFFPFSVSQDLRPFLLRLF